MIYLFYYLGQFFSTQVGSYWCYVYIGIGVLLCFLCIYDNINK